MKKIVALLLILAMLLCVLSLVGCADDKPQGGGETPGAQTQEGGNNENTPGDEGILNNNKIGNDDAANDIFDD